MKKIVLVFLAVFLINLKQGFSQEKADYSVKFGLTAGFLSPQMMIINGYLKSVGSENTSVSFNVPNINLTFEISSPDRMLGFGAILGFDFNPVSENYTAMRYWTIEKNPENASIEDFTTEYDYSHMIFAGCVYFYPHKWLEFKKLRLYARTAVGIENMTVKFYGDMPFGTDGLEEDAYGDYYREEEKFFISLNAGAAYPLSEKIELKSELGYRELSILKLGVNYKF
ncbi:MAG: hypothetical protein ACOCW8_02270 [bacterium]